MWSIPSKFVGYVRLSSPKKVFKKEMYADKRTLTHCKNKTFYYYQNDPNIKSTSISFWRKKKKNNFWTDVTNSKNSCQKFSRTGFYLNIVFLWVDVFVCTFLWSFDYVISSKMSGMRTGDVVVGDGSWNLSIFVTDLQVRILLS